MDLHKRRGYDFGGNPMPIQLTEIMALFDLHGIISKSEQLYFKAKFDVMDDIVMDYIREKHSK